MRQQLIVDADDTLWENNIYFERAFDEFIDFLGHSSLQPREVRAILDEIEIANAKIHGYGSKNFGRNLQLVEIVSEIAREVRNTLFPGGDVRRPPRCAHALAASADRTKLVY